MPTEWILGLLGGLMIGSAAAIYLLVNGRVMGASGILGGLVDGSGRGGAGNRVPFLLGLVLVPAVVAFLTGGWETNAARVPVLLILAGLLVGTGTRLANGCTSGHGVCGISRLSPRGIVATLIYMAAGAATLFVARHVLGVV